MWHTALDIVLLAISLTLAYLLFGPALREKSTEGYKAAVFDFGQYMGYSREEVAEAITLYGAQKTLQFLQRQKEEKVACITSSSSTGT